MYGCGLLGSASLFPPCWRDGTHGVPSGRAPLLSSSPLALGMTCRKPGLHALPAVMRRISIRQLGSVAGAGPAPQRTRTSCRYRPSAPVHRVGKTVCRVFARTSSKPHPCIGAPGHHVSSGAHLPLVHVPTALSTDCSPITTAKLTRPMLRHTQKVCLAVSGRSGVGAYTCLCLPFT